MRSYPAFESYRGRHIVLLTFQQEVYTSTVQCAVTGKRRGKAILDVELASLERLLKTYHEGAMVLTDPENGDELIINKLAELEKCLVKIEIIGFEEEVYEGT